MVVTGSRHARNTHMRHHNKLKDCEGHKKLKNGCEEPILPQKLSKDLTHFKDKTNVGPSNELFQFGREHNL